MNLIILWRDCWQLCYRATSYYWASSRRDPPTTLLDLSQKNPDRARGGCALSAISTDRGRGVHALCARGEKQQVADRKEAHGSDTTCARVVQKTKRGGSYMCHASTCNRYRTGPRAVLVWGCEATPCVDTCLTPCVIMSPTTTFGTCRSLDCLSCAIYSSIEMKFGVELSQYRKCIDGDSNDAMLNFK